MSTQIAVRLPDQVVAYLDREVAEGAAKSRAALIARALERDLRRQSAERDAAILAGTPTDDLDGLVAWTATHAALGD